MKIRIDSIIHLKSGIDVRVTGVPTYKKFYCRTLDKNEHKVVALHEVEYVHSTQKTLF